MKKILLIVLTLLVFTSCNYKKEDEVKPKTSSMNAKGTIEKVSIVKESDLNKDISFSSLNNPNDKKVYDVVGQTNDLYIVKLEKHNLGVIDKDSAKPVVDNNSPKKESTSVTPNEDELIRYINAERVKNNLNPLKVDSELVNVARLKSTDMIEKNYFSHYSPTYGSPFNMLKKFNIKYLSAGENIAYNSSIKGAHEAFMNSPGHRANILNSNYTHVGVGIKESPKYGKMITELFIQK